MDESKENSLILYAHDYTQGYGSFDFLPHQHRWHETQLRRSRTKPSPDEPFPFMRLPIEVRNRIYHILICSMLDTADNYYALKLSIAPRIRFVLRPLEWQPGLENAYEYEFKVTSRYPPDDPRNDPDHFIDLYKAIKDGSLDVRSFNPFLGKWKWEMSIGKDEDTVEEEEYDGDTTDSDEFDLAEAKKKGKIVPGSMTSRQIAIYCERNLPAPPRTRSSAHKEGQSSAQESQSQVDEMDVDVEDESHNETRDYMEICELVKEAKDLGNTETNRKKTGTEKNQADGGEPVSRPLLGDTHQPERGFRLEIDYDNPHTERVFWDYEEVRLLAHVSRQFSREVGACLWHNSVLELEDYEIPAMFIRNRPAALQHVKGVVLNLCYNGAGVLNSSTADLERLFDWMSENLELRFIMVNVKTQLVHLLDWQKGKLDDWTAIFRRSRPMERFHVRVLFEHYCTPPSYAIEKFSCRPIKRKWEKIIGEMWMPDCLREEMNGEIGSYVQSRSTCTAS